MHNHQDVRDDHNSRQHHPGINIIMIINTIMFMITISILVKIVAISNIP